MTSNDPHPSEGELAILRVLWQRQEPSSVRDVHTALSRSKDTAYTTVLKMMTIMADKGLLRRDDSERTHQYSAVHAEPVVQSVLLRDLLRKAFSGSAVRLVQSAIDTEAASADDLDAIAKMIADAKKRRRKA